MKTFSEERYRQNSNFNLISLCGKNCFENNFLKNYVEAIPGSLNNVEAAVH